MASEEAQPTLTAPIFARFGGVSCEIGSFLLAPGADPEVQLNPEQVRLAVSTFTTLSAVAEYRQD